MEILITKKNLKAVKKLGFKVQPITDTVYSVEVAVDPMTFLKTLKDETEACGLFDRGDTVEVLANKGDNFNDFCGDVVGYKSQGIVQVKDQDDNVWDVGENQCISLDIH